MSKATTFHLGTKFSGKEKCDWNIVVIIWAEKLLHNVKANIYPSKHTWHAHKHDDHKVCQLRELQLLSQYHRFQELQEYLKTMYDIYLG